MVSQADEKLNAGQLWSWYLTNLKNGKFEEIINNPDRLEKVKRENTLMYPKLLVSIPASYSMPDIEKIIVKHFGKYISDVKINNLVNIHNSDQKLCIINDTNNKFLYKFRHCMMNDTIVPFIMDPLTPESSPSDASVISDTFMNEIYNDKIQENTNPNRDRTTANLDEEDDADAIVLNFAHKRRRLLENENKETYISPVQSEVVSINSYDTSMYTDYDTNKDSDLNLLKRVTANNKYATIDRVLSDHDIEFKLFSVLCKERNEAGNLWTTIRQDLGDEWVLYDNIFSLDNLECCQLEDVLYGDKEVTAMIFTIA